METKHTSTAKKTIPQLIAVTHGDKEAIYKYGNQVFRSEIGIFQGIKYYSHRGINHHLPKEFQGKN